MIPKKTALSKKIVSTYHDLRHASDVSVRAAIIKDGYYLPSALKQLAKYRRRCVVCKKYTKMGTIGEHRLTPSAPFEFLQSDLKGPLYIQEYVNRRNTRKVWLLTNICHFSRYVSVSVVEDLSTEAIINSIMGHIYRFGRAKVIETDCGNNYKGDQRLLQAEEELESIEWPLIRSKLKSRGIQLVMRGAKMPWITGGAEAANKNGKDYIF